MNSKSSSIIEKAAQERARGDSAKALKRLTDAIARDGADIALYEEAIDVALEATDSLQAVDLFKQAQRAFPNDIDSLWIFAADKMKAYNDAILARYLFESAIKKRDLKTAYDLIDNLRDHTVEDLLKRVRTKKQTLSAATSGGAGFRREITVNTLSEANLCLRTKRFREAMRLYIRVLDDRPVEHATLAPFLAELEKLFPRKGSIGYGVGCCYLAAGDFNRALPKIVNAVVQAPALAEDAIHRLTALETEPNAPKELLEYSLGRIYMIGGDAKNAAASLGAVLTAVPDKAALIVEMLAPEVENVGDDLSLHELYLDATLVAKKPELALAHVRRIYKTPNHRAALFNWLEQKAQLGPLPPSLQVAQGELVLDQGMHERAIEIFRAALAESPQEKHTIAATLSPHTSNRYVKALLDELSDGAGAGAGTDTEATPSGGGGFEIEHFGTGGGFAFNGTPTPRPTPPSQRKAPAAATPLRPAPKARPKTPPATRPAAPRTPDIELPRAPFGAERPPQSPDRPAQGWAVDSKREPAKPEAAPMETPRFHVRLSYDEAPVTKPPAEIADQAPLTEPPAEVAGQAPLTEPPVETAGAAPAPAISEPSVNADVVQEATPPPPVAGPPVDENGFDTLYARFERGELPNQDTLALIERAHREGRRCEMKSLLEFQPRSIGEENQRKFHLAGYQLDEGQPLSALVVLRTVNLAGLGREERRAFLMRIAACYRQLNRFDAAHSVYLRMMSEDRDFLQLGELARNNYQDYVEQLAGDTPILEKVTIV